MEYTKLGRTGLDVSRICLGCMSYGGGNQGNHAWSLGEEESRPFIDKALESGINFFDTANRYSQQRRDHRPGNQGRRDEVVIATKVYGRMRPGPNGAGLSRKAIFAEIDNSLRRLGMDYVDLYQIHRFDHEKVSVELVNLSADLPALGVGEATAGPTAAAIGNAVARALGARLRDLPLTRERVMAALLADQGNS
jgi:aryl-alcohol dehydrogenase-like predicted oxidoreductase